MTRAALVVGINTYDHFRNLKAPARDAEAIAQRLQQDGDFDTVTRLPERIVEQDDGYLNPVVGETSSVSRTALKAALKQLFNPDSDRSQLPETALFYFSGHGLPDAEGFNKGYLVTSDTDPNDPQMALSFRWLQWLLSESPIPRQIVWLDCCHSGGLLIDIDAANPGHREDHSRCFIASSRDFEESWPDLNSPYSVLTKALLEGLDPNRQRGRWVDTFALVDHVEQALKGELQTPTCTNFGKAINLTRTWHVPVEQPSDVAIAGGVCPYKGLEFFDWNDDDPQYFFGREGLTDQLLDQVRETNFIALVGASGSGKSSVLRAGLLYQLGLGRLPGSSQWQILVMRPEDRPLDNLAAAVLPADRPRDRARETLVRNGAAALARWVEEDASPRVVLVIDQFEEVFTLCDDVAEREQFFACLMGAIAETERLTVAIAMRSDFVGKCLERGYSGLAQRVQGGMVSVLPMEPDELEAAIRKPAERVGLTVEDALVTKILDEIQGAPGSLPLLQYTLKALWQRRRDNRLVLSAYQELGGITGTLDRRATELYNGFDEAQQRTARHIFQQLTQLGEGTEDTRRRVFLENLIAEPLHPAAQVKTIVGKLAARDNRLLVTSEVVGKGEKEGRRAIVDVAHEALIRHWKLLRQWIEQNRDLLRQQQRIERSVVTWQTHQQNQRYLLEGWALKEAIRFQQQYADIFPLSNASKRLISKSKWRQRWKELTAGWLIVPAVMTVGIAEYGIREQQVLSDLRRLDAGDKQGTYIVENLIKGCSLTVPFPEQNWLQNYIGERIFGACRSLGRFDLSDANLPKVDLSGAKLSDAKLSNANLSNANLRGADLYNADLSNANLRDADLNRADLSTADLRNANLSDARLSSADLSNANLRGADLSNANLRGADLSFADLSTADLRNAKLNGISSGYGFEVGIYFGSINLSNADLSFADLSTADLRNAKLNGAFLIASDLRDATLFPQRLTGEDKPYLCGAGLSETLKNAGIDPHRDCAPLLQLLEERYSMSPEDAQQIVEYAMQKEWD